MTGQTHPNGHHHPATTVKKGGGSNSPLPSPLSQVHTHNPFFLDTPPSEPQSPSPTEEEKVKEEWEAYIEASRRGEYAGQSCPTMPSLLQQIASPFNSSAVTFDGSVKGHHGSPETAIEFFAREGFMPAISGRYEHERMRVIKRFSAHALANRTAINKIVDMTAIFFKSPIVVVSIVLDDREVLVSTHGWDKDERHPGFELINVPLATSFCSHTTSRSTNEECFVLENTAEDWRFRNNPYCKDGGPIAFFASSNMYLPTISPNLPSTRAADITAALPSELSIGSLCLVDREPHAKNSWSAEHGEILRGFGDMIAREILLAFEQSRAELVAKQAAFLGDFLRTSLVNPSYPTTSGQPSSSTSTSAPTFRSAAESLRELTNAESVVILDLRAYKAPYAPSLEVERLRSHAGASVSASSSSPSATSVNGTSSTPTSDFPKRPVTPRGISNTSFHSSDSHSIKPDDAGRLGSIGVLGSAGSYSWEQAVLAPGMTAALNHALITFYSDGVAEFDLDTIPSPLSDILPLQTTASLSCPIFDHDGRPGLFFILCSTEKYFRFEPHDRNFVENVGAISISTLLRQKILDADRAKLAFLSSISHELRLPLHSISSQLELIRTVATPAAVQSIRPLLDTADVSCESLRDILDDTLQFSKLSNASEANSARQAPTVEVDLEALITQVVKSCWTTAKKQDSVNGHLVEKEVDLVLKYRVRQKSFLVDIGGLKRTLFNLIGNSIKFTSNGSITVVVKSVEESEAEPTSGREMIGIDVIDTGRGMSEEFIREHLFVPFRQEDSFSQGAGLGISIVESIVRRMKGRLSFTSKLGVGTVASVVLPLESIGEQSPRSKSTSTVMAPEPISRRISLELNAALDNLSMGAASDAESGEAKTPLATPTQLASVPTASFPAPALPVAQGLESLRILVVDDNQIARRILTTFLKAKKVPFVEAVDGQDALDKFKSFHPHSVWLDVMMPNLDGIQASSLMREYEAQHDLPRAKIIMLSGLSGDFGNHAQVLETGQVDQWIVKGGPSLKILGAEIARMTELLAETGSPYY